MIDLKWIKLSFWILTLKKQIAVHSNLFPENNTILLSNPDLYFRSDSILGKIIHLRNEKFN